MSRQSTAAGTQGMVLRCAERQVAAWGQSGVLAADAGQGTWAGPWNGVPSRYLDRDSSAGTKVEIQP